MRRVSVSSSNVAEIGYDVGSRVLEIMFMNGGVYQYFEVPERIYNELMSSSSIGSYIHGNIKGIYRYSRV